MQPDQLTQNLPSWLPQSVARYVAHTEQGISIRELARRDGCHASTVMRQIRKLEAMREDPLVDDAFQRFRSDADADADGEDAAHPLHVPAEELLRREAKRVLQRLCETGAVLAVAADMENAVVVRDGGTRTAVVAREIVQAMVLKGWIASVHVARVTRYAITPSGRAALSRMVAEQENAAQGFAESQAGFGDRNKVLGRSQEMARRFAQQGRFTTAESPLSILARRRGKDGKPFLGDAEVAAGERLREDFELAQMGTEARQDWARFLMAPSKMCYRSPDGGQDGAEAARQRVAEAVAYLGDHLCDVTLRCCCFLEGLETAERQLGWSARSGKVVLRIALARLSHHYQANAGGAGDYIG